MKGLFLKADFTPRPEYKLSEYENKTGKIYASNMVWKNPELQLKKLPDPGPGPKDLLIKTKACGICGTDVHLLEHDAEGYVIYPGHSKMNIALGHEMSGIVMEVGKDVKDFEVGDYVCTEEMIWCGECIPCRNGFPNQCERLEEIGLTVNGGMAEYVVSPAKICWKLNNIREYYGDSQDIFDMGAMVEPASVAYNAIFERGQGFRPGAYAVIYGGGPVGLLAASLIKTGGASKVIVFEPQEERRILAKKMGADHVIDTNAIMKQGLAPHEVVMELTQGRGADFQVEASGLPHITMPEMIKSVAVNCHIIQTAMSGDAVPIVFPPLQAKAGQIFASIGHSGNGTFENVIRLMAAGMMDIRPLITSTYSIDEGVQAFEAAKKRQGAVIMFQYK